MTTEQARAVLGITREDLAALIASGQLPVTGGRPGVRVTDAAMEEYIARTLPDRLAAS
jgi:hypothetical protein